MGMRMRRWVVAGAFVGVLGLGFAAGVSADESDLGQAGCDNTIAGLDKQLARATLLGNVFAVSGAALAALGSAIAGASTGKKSWVAASIGIVGAIVTALPKTLPDRAEIQRRLSLADQHRTRGVKTALQIPLLQDKAFADQCRQYAIARFVDCSSADPPKDVPELPRQPSGKKVAAAEAATEAAGGLTHAVAPAPPAAPAAPPAGGAIPAPLEALQAAPPPEAPAPADTKAKK